MGCEIGWQYSFLHGDDCGIRSGCASGELNFSLSIHSACGGGSLDSLVCQKVKVWAVLVRRWSVEEVVM